MKKLRDILDKLRILRDGVIGVYEWWKDDIWPRDLDETYCCDGRECGCGGVTVREAHLTEKMYDDVNVDDIPPEVKG